MKYLSLVKKQFFSSVPLVLICYASYRISYFFGDRNPLVESDNFKWILLGALLSYFFLLPLINLWIKR